MTSPAGQHHKAQEAALAYQPNFLSLRQTSRADNRIRKLLP